MAKKVIAIILAAGYSKRMGMLKATLPLRGLPLIMKQIRCIQNAGIDEIIVVTGHRSEEIESILDREDVHIVYNPDYAEGMFSSLKTGLRAIVPESFDAFLFLPVDYPMIRPYMIRLLIDAYETQHKKLAYLRYNGKKGHPPLLSSDWIMPILAYEGEDGIKGLIKPFDDQAVYVDLPNNECILNMNTPEEYLEIIEADQRKTGPDAEELALMIRSYPVGYEDSKLLEENFFYEKNGETR
jgi:molybdenum cofactor cytidylyltransferase